MPHIISIGYLLFSVLVTLYLWIWVGRENERCGLVRGQEIEGDAEFLASADRQRLGDRLQICDLRHYGFLFIGNAPIHTPDLTFICLTRTLSVVKVISDIMYDAQCGWNDMT